MVQPTVASTIPNMIQILMLQQNAATTATSDERLCMGKQAKHQLIRSTNCQHDFCTHDIAPVHPKTYPTSVLKTGFEDGLCLGMQVKSKMVGFVL